MKQHLLPRRPLTKAACVAALVGLPLVWFGAIHTVSAARPSGTWHLVFERPATTKYNDLAFPDSIHGWAVNAAGFILNTDDGGTTWKEQASGLGALRSIDFLDTRRGFAGTLSGVLYGTKDGGVTWTDISATLPRHAAGFCGITHVGEEVHIVGKYVGNATDYFYSPDGGNSWRYSNLSDLAQALVAVTFMDKNVGFIGGMGKSPQSNMGSAVLLKTVDGGRNWREVFHDSGGRGYIWKFFPLSTKLIYASLQSQDGTYRIAKSTDLGDHWQVLTVATGQPVGPGVQGLGFLDDTTGWVGGFFPGMWATTDGGKTWTQLLTGDGTINRFRPVGHTLFTAGTRGILRFDRP